MISILINWVVVSVAILIISHLLPGVKVDNIPSAAIAAAVLGILNAVLKPVVSFLALPFIWLTLGLLLIVINALMFYLAGMLAPGFRVKDFWSALQGSLLVTVISWVSNCLLT